MTCPMLALVARNRDGKNFIGMLITCFKGSDGYKIIMEGYVMYGGHQWLRVVTHGYRWSANQLQTMQLSAR